MLEWIAGVPTVVKAAGLLMTAAGTIYAFVKRGDRLLLWLLAKFWDHKGGGIRIVKSSVKGRWLHVKDKPEEPIRLTSQWYVTNLLDQDVRILTAEIEKPVQMNGHLYQESPEFEEITWPLNTVLVPPGVTAVFHVWFEVPTSHSTEGKELKTKITFTDHFNNRHYRKVIFAPPNGGS